MIKIRKRNNNHLIKKILKKIKKNNIKMKINKN